MSEKHRQNKRPKRINLPKRATLTQGSQWYEGNEFALRPRQYLIFLAIMYVAVNLVRFALPGLPLGGDFVVFQVASEFLARGEASLAYQPDLFAAAAKASRGISGVYHWYYPPPAFFITLPLAWMPYGVSMVLWSIVSLLLYWKAMQALAGNRPDALVALTYGGVMMGLLFGQNGLFIGACIGASLAWREKRPWLAGVMAMLVAIKPQCVIVLALVLLYERNWKALASATLSGLAVIAASIACFGIETWIAWQTNLEHAMGVIAHGQNLWAWLSSIFAALLGLGASPRIAILIHIAALIGVLVALWRFHRWRPDPRLWNAAILIASCFASPYFFTYDLAMVGGAIMLLNQTLREKGWRPFDKEWLTLANFAPMIVPFLAMATPLFVQPLILLKLLHLTIRRS